VYFVKKFYRFNQSLVIRLVHGDIVTILFCSETSAMSIVRLCIVCSISYLLRPFMNTSAPIVYITAVHSVDFMFVLAVPLIFTTQ